jgi:hypothetical protein
LRGGGEESNVTFFASASHTNMKNLNRIIIPLLILMVASTFIGVPLNGGDKGWLHVYDGELGLFINTLISSSTPLSRTILLVLQLITHLALFILPVFIKSKHFFGLLIGIPLLYLSLQTVTFIYFLILLVPFIILWITALIVWQYDNKPKTNS